MNQKSIKVLIILLKEKRKPNNNFIYQQVFNCLKKYINTFGLECNDLKCIFNKFLLIIVIFIMFTILSLFKDMKKCFIYKEFK